MTSRFKLLSGVVALGAMLVGLGTAKAADSDWAQYGKGFDGTHYSPLNQINTGNVSKLKLAYTLSLGTLRSNESTPIVIGDTMYVASSWGPKYVYALNAKTGDVKWKYEADIPDDVLQYACCDVNTRGVSYADGKIFVGRLDGKLSAVDAKTGNELWVSTVVDYKQGSVITSPPLVVKGKVITGFGGGEYGARGSIQAFDANTGKELWRTYTVPLANEEGGDSWKGDSAVHGGGVAWLIPSYDPKTNTVFYGTSNPGPWLTAVRTTGDSNYGKLTNKWTSATVALDVDTGKLKWGFQGTPADAWDYDGVNEFVLADLKINGKMTPVGMKADRNGFFYVLNRDDGKLISADKFVAATNWASKIDLATGLPVEDPAKRPGPNHPAKDICPNLVGGKNWQPMSYDPQTGYVYIPANNICQDMSEAKSVDYKKGVFFLGKDFSASAGPGNFLGDIEAWDPIAKKAVWHIHEQLPFNGGMLSTGGGVVFYGSLAGVFKAVDAKTGKELWSEKVGSGVGAAPMTYSVDGKQYVAVVSGRTAAIPAFLGDVGKKMTDATPEGGMLFVFTE